MTQHGILLSPAQPPGMISAAQKTPQCDACLTDVQSTVCLAVSRCNYWCEVTLTVLLEYVPLVWPLELEVLCYVSCEVKMIGIQYMRSVGD